MIAACSVEVSATDCRGWQRLQQALECCCLRFAGQPDVLEHPRFVSAWLDCAAACPEPLRTIRRACSLGVGRQSVALLTAHCRCLRSVGDLAAARQLLTDAVASGGIAAADPDLRSYVRSSGAELEAAFDRQRRAAAALSASLHSAEAVRRAFDAQLALLDFCRAAFGDQAAHSRNCLRQCAEQFRNCAETRDDVRYVRVWLAYADGFADPLDVMLYMESKAIGQRCSVFYRCKARYFESRAKPAQAEDTYHQGFAVCATPLRPLIDAYRFFRDRRQQRLAVKKELRRRLLLAASSSLSQCSSSLSTLLHYSSSSQLALTNQSPTIQLSASQSSSSQSSAPLTNQLSLSRQHPADTVLDSNQACSSSSADDLRVGFQSGEFAALRAAFERQVLEPAAVRCNEVATARMKKGQTVQLTARLSFFVVRKIGAGSFGRVFLVRTTGGGDELPDGLWALKIEATAALWENHVMALVQQRVDAAVRHRYGCFRRHFVNSSASFGFAPWRRAGSLHDAINAYLRHTGGGLPEQLCVYYSLQILHILEHVHRAGIVHGDVKTDNFLLMLPDAGEQLPDFCADAESGAWSAAGLQLIDFGHSADLLMCPGRRLAFVGGAQAGGRTGQRWQHDGPWTYELDLFAAGLTIYTMLFGKQPPAFDRLAGLERPPLRRYWNRQLWTRLFDSLLGRRAGDTSQQLQSLLRRELADAPRTTAQLTVCFSFLRAQDTHGGEARW